MFILTLIKRLFASKQENELPTIGRVTVRVTQENKNLLYVIRRRVHNACRFNANLKAKDFLDTLAFIIQQFDGGFYGKWVLMISYETSVNSSDFFEISFVNKENKTKIYSYISEISQR